MTLIKSGTDFEEFSEIKINMTSGEIIRERVLITDIYQAD